MSFKRNTPISYINKWKCLGYFYDIPDEVPQSLSKENLAPSYKALAIALLNNDHALKSLGMTQPKSKAYSMLKQIELKARKEK